MSDDVLEFGGFRLEPAERRLTRDSTVVEVSGRYLDALLLLARRPGELITKDRFMAEVWRGVPVTDEALTQCIRSLRKALGDEAARPKFIETVPRHGYRFVAEVRSAAEGATSDPMTGRSAPVPARPARKASDPVSATANTPDIPSNAHTVKNMKGGSAFKAWPASSQLLLVAGAGLVGGAGAGLVGGIGYGLIAATEPPPGTGAISILLVMTCLCLMVGLLGGLCVGSGSAIGRLIGPGRLFPAMLGGAVGGLAVGAMGRLVGLDAFSLLIGSRPLAITGGSEGLIIGALAGAALWIAERESGTRLREVAGKGALLGTLAGLLVTLGGGKMMAGSLAGLAAAHPDAPLGRLLGDPSPYLLMAAGAAEGAIFIGALTLAFALALRSRAGF